MSKPSLRNFDPNRVDQLDTEMWKAYYSRNYRGLLRLLFTLLKEQFHLKGFSALLAAYYSAKSALEFQKTHDDKDTQAKLAYSYLEKFYSCVKRNVSEEFAIQEVSNKELHWWYVHRYPKRYSRSLKDTLIDTMTSLYSVSSKDLEDYGKYRAEAMHKRDTARHVKKVEPDWKAIEKDLQLAYQALYQAVN